jgi:hypothetical protein
MLNDDGDIVRGLGFVALYAAYLEEQIDNLLEALDQVEAYDSAKQRWPIGRKIKHAIDVIGRLDTSEFPDYTKDLQTCLKLFEDRNEIIHGRIYANFDRPETLKSGRRNKPDKEIHSEELYELANEFDDFRAAVYRELIFKIPKAVNKYVSP